MTGGAPSACPREGAHSLPPRGVPLALLPKECAAVVLELKKRPRPRSPSLTTPVAVMNTFAGLMSGHRGAIGGKMRSVWLFSGTKNHFSW